MITLTQILVLIFAVLVGMFFVKQKHKVVILCMGLLTGALGLYVEYSHIADGKWAWFNNGASLLGVPHIVTIAYFFSGILIASAAVSSASRNLFEKLGNNLFYFFLIPFGIFYWVFAKEVDLLIIVLAAFVFSKYQKDSYFVTFSALIAASDVILENILMLLGYITYACGYTGDVYIGFFVASLLIMISTYLISKKGKLFAK